MSSRHRSSDHHRSRSDRDRDRHDRRQDEDPDTRRESRRDNRNEDFNSVRVKEEPMSDVEGNLSSRSRPEREGGARHSPRHQRRERSSRSRSPIDRQKRRSPPRRRSRSRSRSPRRNRTEEFKRPQERRRSPRRDNDRPPPASHRNDSRSSNNERPAREKDWEKFFKPGNKVEDEDSKYGKKDQMGDKPDPKDKEKPNFDLSGKLTEETNTFRGVVIKYSEPPEARKPQKIRWRLYPFKGEEALPVMYIHRQSAYLLGRERKIADIPIDHPSCSKQHAVIQYRLMKYERADGSVGRRIRPYVIDLESGNGTYVNGTKIEPKRYVELIEKDVLKFGFSSREYVLLHEQSKDDPDDDEYEQSPEPDEKVKVKVEKEEVD